MLKFQIPIKLFTILILLFLIGCASNKQSTKPKSNRNLFSDPEIAAFMEDESNDAVQNSQQSFKNTERQRPFWATVHFLAQESANHIGRVGFSEIGKRRPQVIEDSLKKELRELISGDVETRVDRVIEDSISTRITMRGRQKEASRIHILTAISRHYSPPLTFNGDYDENYSWKDDSNDTLWYYIKFNKTKYRKEEQERIVSEIKKAGDQAYLSLKNAFNALNQKSDMKSALSHLGVASYYISKGGGVEVRNDLFNPGNDQNLLVQRNELINEIDKNINIRLNNSTNEKIATKTKPFGAEVVTTNSKNYDLKKVGLRIKANPDIFNFSPKIELDGYGSTLIKFRPLMNSYGRSDSVFITFDVISEMIPDKEWYNSEDYTDLLKELPMVVFKIETKEFAPLKTWAFIHSDIPDNLDAEGLQRSLQRILEEHPDYLAVIRRNNWPINYNRARQYISDRIQINELTFDEREDIQNHDIDIWVEISGDGYNLYTLTLVGHSPGQQEGGVSTKLSGIHFTDIKNKFEPLVESFINDYFERIVELTTPELNEKHKLNFSLDDKKIKPKKMSNGILEFRGISRFNTHTLIVKSQKYSRQVFTLDGDRYHLPSLKKSTIKEIPMNQLIPIQGTLSISVLDSLTGEPIPYNRKGKGVAPVIKVRKWYGFFPNPFILAHISNDGYKTSIPLKKIGKYYISVKKDFYFNPIPQVVSVYDDEDEINKYKNNIRFLLLEQDKKAAKIKSAIIPGWGQYSLGKKKEGIMYFAGATLSIISVGVESYKYRKELNNYNQIKTEYLNSQENWENLEKDLSGSKDKLIINKNGVYGSVASLFLVWGFNLFTVTW